MLDNGKERAAKKKPTKNSTLSIREMLEQETARLQKLAELDGLTGLLNRSAIEHKINQLLKTSPQGALLLLDIDNFEGINLTYGHLAGDEVLRTIGYVLNKMFMGKFVARTGGDTFLVFYPEVSAEAELTKKAAQLRARLAQIKIPDTNAHFTITIGTACYQTDDSYQTLSSRASKELLQKKQQRMLQAQLSPPVEKTPVPKFHTDTALIAKGLREHNPAFGAFYQSYEMFQAIFRFLERSLCRTPSDGIVGKMTVVLFTLADWQNSVSEPEYREEQMSLLQGEIQDNLRLSDIFIQYSSCQYLVLLSGADEPGAELVAKRICDSFYMKNPEAVGEVILHHSFPLKPASRPNYPPTANA